MTVALNLHYPLFEQQNVPVPETVLLFLLLCTLPYGTRLAAGEKARQSAAIAQDIALLAVPAAALVIAGTAMLARRTGVNLPVAMLVAGIVLAFLPGVPPIAIDPEIVLMTLLPPILYASGVGMSWRGFRYNLRPILLLAVGCVVFTAGALAALLNWLFAWPPAVGFLLGAIVSPPDAVAPGAILRAMPLPRRLKTVLEGESLINDATALVAFTFALGAISSGAFSLPQAALVFSSIVVSEIAYGLALGWLVLRLRHVAHDPRVEVLLALATPFLAFWPPHAYGGSGVVACVTAGLYVSWNGRRLIRPTTRLQGYFIWNLVTWAVEAVAFLLTGLQAKALTQALASSGWVRALEVSIVTCLAIVLVRFIWVYPATYLPRLIPAVRRRDPLPDWRMPFFVASAGIRGVVSMIAALSVPLTLNGAPFPYRDEILFATFAAILFTMLGLGGVLQPVARWLQLDQVGRREQDSDADNERRVRAEGIDAVLQTLDAMPDNACTQAELGALKRRHRDRREQLAAQDHPHPHSLPAGQLQLRIIAVEREVIARAYAENRLTDGARRRIEREIDLEEARIHHAIASMGAGH